MPIPLVSGISANYIRVTSKYRITTFAGMAHMDMQEASMTGPTEAELDEALARGVRKIIAGAIESEEASAA